MRFNRVATLSAIILLAGLSSANAASCNFSKPIGSCKGTISIDSTKGSKGNYSAEATVRSSSPTCSKVEYLIDNTPNQTILKSSNSDSESLFGTSPVTKKTVKITKCTAYEDRDAVTSKDGGDATNEVAGPKFFNGTWEGQVGMMFLKAGMTLTMNVNGSTVTGGSHAHNGTGDYQIRNGRVSGNRVTFDYAQPMGGETANVVITRKSANSIEYSGSASGVTMSGTLTRK